MQPSSFTRGPSREEPGQKAARRTPARTRATLVVQLSIRQQGRSMGARRRSPSWWPCEGRAGAGCRPFLTVRKGHSDFQPSAGTRSHAAIPKACILAPSSTDGVSMSSVGDTFMPSPAVDPEAAAVARPRQRNMFCCPTARAIARQSCTRPTCGGSIRRSISARTTRSSTDDRRRYVSGSVRCNGSAAASVGACRATCATSTVLLCRHYRPGRSHLCLRVQPGAFTVRTLAGLVCKCGILDQSKTVPRFRLFRLGYEDVQLNTDEGLTARSGLPIGATVAATTTLPSSSCTDGCGCRTWYQFGG